MNLNTCHLSIQCDSPVKTHAGKVRGFVGKKFTSHLLLHNHLGDREYLYLYPRVQYRTMDGNVKIIGIEEGIEEVAFLEKNLDYLYLNGKRFVIKEKYVQCQTENFQQSSTPNTYDLVDPWLPLNSTNYMKVKSLPDEKRTQKLSKILIGNILSICKSFGYVVHEKLTVKLHLERIDKRIVLNGNQMASFLGTFSVNFEIPDLWGIGKSVSRGFGTIKRVREQRS